MSLSTSPLQATQTSASQAEGTSKLVRKQLCPEPVGRLVGGHRLRKETGRRIVKVYKDSPVCAPRLPSFPELGSNNTLLVNMVIFGGM